jgi:hypothetical protein
MGHKTESCEEELAVGGNNMYITGVLSEKSFYRIHMYVFVHWEGWGGETKDW